MSSPAAKLLRWYDTHGRDLPWRRTRDPYAILVSEIMLQQTQVDRVLPFYDRWLKAFPNWASLADASNADVLGAWAGLGYNRRALMLRDIARQVVDRGVPRTEEEWRALKGIGMYTAAAVALFSARIRTVPIDTNTRRVFARVLDGIPYPDPADDAALRQSAFALLPKRGRYDDFIQAVFDLASTVCGKRPDCAACPLQRDCKAADAFLAGVVATPASMVKKAHERRHPGKPHPDRIYRGRILKLVRERGSIRIAEIGPAVDPSFEPDADASWLAAMLSRLEQDGMLERYDKKARVSSR